VVGLAVPRAVAGASSVTRPIRVLIQNRGDHAEVIAAAQLGEGVTSGLVRLQVTVEDDDGEGCLPALVELDSIRNARTFASGPKLLRPRRVLTIHYLVTHQCAAPRPRSGADATPGDYRHTATVHHEVLDGEPDGHPEDDACPHDALGGGRDPNPPPHGVRDRGCGARKPDGTRGAPVLTDVVPRG